MSEHTIILGSASRRRKVRSRSVILHWLNVEGPVRLVAELRAPGHVRLSPEELIQPRIDAVRERLTAQHYRPTEHLAALNDRFRQVSYYPSDTRLHLSEAIAVYLGTPSSGEMSFYVEARGDHIDVMTLDLRSERLERLGPEIEIRDNDVEPKT